MKRIYRWLAIGGAIVGLILLLVFASSWFSLGYWFGKNPIFVSHGTNLIENGWRTLDLDFVSLESGDEKIRILVKLEEGKVPRLKLEHVVGRNIYLLCEYVKSEHGSYAQKFDPSTGMAVAYLNPALFVPAYNEIASGKEITGKNTWTLARTIRSGGGNPFDEIVHVCWK